jgi:hypothetical protein
MRSMNDGVFTLSLVAVDAAGNRGSTVTSPYTLDRKSPLAPTITGGPTGLVNTPVPTWTFALDVGALGQCSLRRGSTVAFGPVACADTVSIDMSNLPDGTYTFTVATSDPAGNVGPSSSSAFSIDLTAPAAPVITGGPSSTSTDDTPTWTFRPVPGATLSCTVYQGTTIVAGPVSCSSPAAFDLTSAVAGVYTFSVVAIDPVGNASTPATSSYTLQTSRQAPPAPPRGGGTSGSGGGGSGSPAVTPTTIPNVTPSTALPGQSGTTLTTRPGARGGTSGRPGSGGNGDAGNGGGSDGESDSGDDGGINLDDSPAAPIIAAGRVAGRVATEVSKRAAFPLLLFALVILFLAIQNQIDRRDPKLADAPLHSGDDLEFGPPPSRKGEG